MIVGYRLRFDEQETQADIEARVSVSNGRGVIYTRKHLGKPGETVTTEFPPDLSLLPGDTLRVVGSATGEFVEAVS